MGVIVPFSSSLGQKVVCTHKGTSPCFLSIALELSVVACLVFSTPESLYIPNARLSLLDQDLTSVVDGVTLDDAATAIQTSRT